MIVTDVRIKLVEANRERLLGFCSVTFDDMFVIRDLKIIDGGRGWFVAMPSRKLTDRCPECAAKNQLRSRYCGSCGLGLDEDRAIRGTDGRAKLHADIAHPIHGGCREMIERAVFSAYREELKRSKSPGYVCRYDEIDAGDFEDCDGRLHRGHGHSGPHVSAPAPDVRAA